LTRRRWLLAGTIILAVAQTCFWLIGMWIALHLVGWLVSVPLTLGLSIGAGLNVLALVVFLTRRRAWGTPAFVAVQVGNVLFSLAASVLVSPTWLLLGVAPAVATLMLHLLQRRADPVTPSNRPPC
jgi:hypothetical protein